MNKFMMNNTPKFAYVELPYKSEAFTLCLMLPKGRTSLRDILVNLSYATLMGLLKSSAPTQVEVHLPVARVHSNVDLAYVWQFLGICRPFEKGQAAFTQMVANHRELFLESVVSNFELSLQALSAIGSSNQQIHQTPLVTVNSIDDSKSAIPLFYNLLRNNSSIHYVLGSG